MIIWKRYFESKNEIRDIESIRAEELNIQENSAINVFKLTKLELVRENAKGN